MLQVNGFLENRYVFPPEISGGRGGGVARPGLRLLGTAPHKAGVVPFVVDGAHAQDIALLIDQLGVAIRTGNHCAQPLLQHFGVTATCRASFAAYNTSEEIDIFVAALARAVEMVR